LKMSASDIFWTIQIGVIVAFWLWIIGSAVVVFFRAKDKNALFRIEDKKTPLKVVGVLLLLLLVYFPVIFTLERLLPAQRFHRFIYGVDESGEPFDRREILAFLVAVPVTYILVRGWYAWRNRPWK
jgi:hypothetical protein